MKIEIVKDRTEELISQLTQLWELSVKATHHFLTEGDIADLKPMVKEAVREIKILAVGKTEEAEEWQCFMGVEPEEGAAADESAAQGKIEMLFAHPEARGKGIGKEMVKFAVEELRVVYVDVNEQNEAAAGFYRRMGFQQIARSELDSQGNPFPILHLKLSDTNEQ